MLTAEKRLNEHHAPSEVWVTHYALDTSEPERQWLDHVSTTPWAADYKAQITEWAAQTRYVRADIAAAPGRCAAMPLDMAYVQKHAFIAGVVAARNIPATHPCSGPLLWLDYDPGDNPALARILAAIEPHPDPRDAVIARLVELAQELIDMQDWTGTGSSESGDREKAAYQQKLAALAAAKAVQQKE